MSDNVGGKFVLVRRIASGGMGELHLARQIGPGGFSRQVILKRLHRDLADQLSHVEQFLAEARLAAAASHPFVVTVHEVTELNGDYLIAMEYVHGADLRHLIRMSVSRAQPIPSAVCAALIRDAALGLDHIHHLLTDEGEMQTVVHGDVSPQNLMLRSDGVLKLIDFGIARLAPLNGSVDLGPQGKFGYMSPEQIETGRVDARSDQFALGIVLWELLVRKRLFASPTPDVLRQIIDSRIRAPSGFNAEVSPELDRIVLKMLAADPAQRFQSCGALAESLGAIVEASGSILVRREQTRIAEALVQAELPRRVAPVVPSVRGSETRAERGSSSACRSFSVGDGALLGRDDQIERMLSAVGAVEASEPRLLFWVGGAGVGKSAMLATQARMATERGFQVVALDAKLFESAPALGLWRELGLKLFSGLSPQSLDSPSLDALSARLGPGPATACWYGLMNGLPNKHGPAELAAALVALVLANARLRPIALLVDDLDLADPSFVSALATLAEQLPAAKVLIGLSATQRIERFDECRIDLLPLADSATKSLLRRTAHGCYATIDQARSEALVSLASGNPRTIIELVQALVFGDTALPRGIEAVWISRFDRLTPAARDLICRGAVIGQAFPLELACRGDNPPLAECLDSRLLVEVRPGWPCFAGRTAWQVVLNRLPRASAKRLRLELVDRLLKRDENRIELAARLLLVAAPGERAAQVASRAAELLRSRGLPESAQVFYRAALGTRQSAA